MQMTFYGWQGKLCPDFLHKKRIEVHAPLIQIDNGYFIEVVETDTIADFRAEKTDKLLAFIEDEYRKWGKFGYYGDVINVFCHLTSDTVYYHIIYFGRFAYRQPSLVADFLPFFVDYLGNVIYVGIIRKDDDGQRRISIIGGFQEVQGLYFQTPALAAIEEAGQEAGLNISPTELDRSRIISEPFADELRVKLTLGENILIPKLYLLKTYFTPPSNQPHPSGVRKVDWATAYMMAVKVPDDIRLSKQYLGRYLQAGDDAAELVFFDLIQGERPDFKDQHHAQMFADALGQLRAKSYAV